MIKFQDILAGDPTTAAERINMFKEGSLGKITIISIESLFFSLGTFYAVRVWYNEE